MMHIHRKSLLTGVERKMYLPVTPEQLQDWADGALAQDAFPNCSADEREFIMTGITAWEWHEYMGDDE